MQYKIQEQINIHPHNGDELRSTEVVFSDGNRVNFYKRPTEAEIHRAYLRKKAQDRVNDQIYNIKTQLIQEIMRHPKNKTFSVTIK